MTAAACHGQREETPKERARRVILKDLGVHRVAGWCDVTIDAVYQWLHRGTDTEPIPASRVAAIVTGARKDGVPVNAGDLWPAMRAFA